MSRLGISVGTAAVHAVLASNRGIAWAGRATYAGLPELADALGRLAAEAGRAVRRARIVLERDVVQIRSVLPAPPLKPGAVRGYVALEAPRLFRKNGAALATDGRIVSAGAKARALYAAAVAEPLVAALLEGAAQAGLRVETLGPAADVLPFALRPAARQGEIAFAGADRCEVLSLGPAGTWRSRLLAGGPASESPGEQHAWAAPLGALGDDAPRFAAAYAAAGRVPSLELWPAAARAGRARDRRRRMGRVGLAGGVAWLLAATLYIGRLLASVHATTVYLASVSAPLDGALAARRDLDAGVATLRTMAAAQRTRSRQLGVLADVTAALGDSAYLVAYRIEAGGTLRLAGYAPGAARVVANLSRLPALRDAHLEGPVTREAPGGGPVRDRFAIVAQLAGRP